MFVQKSTSVITGIFSILQICCPFLLVFLQKWRQPCRGMCVPTAGPRRCRSALYWWWWRSRRGRWSALWADWWISTWPARRSWACDRSWTWYRRWICTESSHKYQQVSFILCTLNNLLSISYIQYILLYTRVSVCLSIYMYVFNKHIDYSKVVIF